MLRYGLYGGGRGALAGRTGRAADAKPAEAKSVIQIWLAGGPSHVDSFDPKPAAGNDYCGPLNNPIATNVDGIRIGELLPLLAKQADKFSLIRSMTHGDNGHETAAYLMQTGRRPGDRLVFPCAGAVVSLFKGYEAEYKGLIPPYIVLTESQGRFSKPASWGPAPHAVRHGRRPGTAEVHGGRSRFARPSDEQQAKRRKLLRKLDTLGSALKDDPALTIFHEAEDQAYDMILGDGPQSVQSFPRVRCGAQDASVNWGRWVSRTRFGQSCLAARRLVQRRALHHTTIPVRESMETAAIAIP